MTMLIPGLVTTTTTTTTENDKQTDKLNKLIKYMLSY